MKRLSSVPDPLRARALPAVLSMAVASMAVVALLLASPVPVRAQDDAAEKRSPGRSPDAARWGVPRRSGYTREAEAAVEQGLSFLAERQNPNGSWTDRVGRKVYTSYRGRIAEHVGVTALCGMAFLSNGVLPGGGPPGKYWRRGELIDSSSYRDRDGKKVYGHQVVEGALDYVIARTSSTGFITDNGSRMYSHAFAALFLAEAYGMGYSRDDGRLQDALRRAIRMIEDSQNDEGGWRYRPQSEDSDMSITVCQVLALRAARNAGMGVAKETIDSAVRYVRSSFLGGIGAFTYQLGPEFRGVPSRHSFALTAAGVTTLYGAGEYDETRMIQPAIRYLWAHQPRTSEARRQFDYYYGQYYAVQALFQKGGEDWRAWYDDYIKPDLLALQESDGAWRDLVGDNYATAMAVIILQFPNQYLPITEN